MQRKAVTDSAIRFAQLANELLGKSEAQLSQEEARVLRHIVERRVGAQDTSDIADAEAGVGERLSDRIAAIGGSWPFLIGFAVVLLSWMLLNSRVLGALDLGFDPYPYIFLNLMLSMLAAVQAPIIMMSQNRQSEKDRIAAGHDYEVNLRMELEIMRIHRKLDKIAERQQAQG